FALHAICSGQSVTSISVTNGGSGYSAGSVGVTFTGGCVTEPTASVTLAGGVVTNIPLTTGGSQCSSPPIVIVTSGIATGINTVTGAVTITNGGTGYTAGV